MISGNFRSILLLSLLIGNCVQVALAESQKDDNSTSIGEDNRGDVEERQANLDETLDPSNLDKRSSNYVPQGQAPGHKGAYGGQGSPESRPYGNSYKSEGYAKPPPPKKEVKPEVYDAVTYQNMNESFHCGVIPDTNFELYQSHPSGYGRKGVYDIAPFSKFPWTVLITYKNKYSCTGVLIQSQHVLTSAACVPEYRSLSKYRVRVGDWDLLTNYNEYEAYRNEDYQICGRYPVGDEEVKYSAYNQRKYQKQYGGQEELVILRISNRINFDKRPHVKPICLPAQTYGSSYLAGSPSYPAGSPNYPSYAKAPTHCWVVGWYGSKKTPLDNHPQPSTEESYGNKYSQKYNQKYYTGYDKSFVQKRAKVKEIECQGQSRGYSYSSDKSVCFVGVEGYDSCVADRGAAIFCVIPEKSYGGNKGYESGYTKPKGYYGASPHAPQGAYHPSQYQSLEDGDAEVVFPQKYGGKQYEKTPYQKDIKAHPTQPKSPRYRAVLYAIVQKPTKCSKKSVYSESYYSKGEEQSKPIRATKVDYDTVRNIISTFWESAEDLTCPVPTAYFKGPSGSRAYKYGSSPRKANYNPY